MSIKNEHISKNKQRLLMSEDAIEGDIFYNNTLLAPENVEKYFPKRLGETAGQYKRRPKISVPISQSIIDRIINILLKNIIFSSENAQIQEIYEYLYRKINIKEILRNVMVNTISTGNNLFVTLNGSEFPTIENWSGEYVIVLNENLFGYTYVWNKDKQIIEPVKQNSKDDDILLVLIDDYFFGDYVHNLGYNPSVLTRNVDLYKNNIYGKPYSLRYDDMILEYDQIISQMSITLKILQSVWVTNKDFDDNESPIRLDPGVINFLGENGTLEQVVRQGDISQEHTYLEYLERQISRISHVPGELSGLKAVGTLPSGIALQVLLEPLVEIVERFTETLAPKVKQIIETIIKGYMVINNIVIPESLEIKMQTNNDIFPTAKEDAIDQIIKLKDNGLISEQQARNMLDPYIKIDGE